MPNVDFCHIEITADLVRGAVSDSQHDLWVAKVDVDMEKTKIISSTSLLFGLFGAKNNININLNVQGNM